MKDVVTISKHWHRPKINTVIWLNNNGITYIRSQIDIDDFIIGLKREINIDPFIDLIKNEIGSITWTFKKETFDKQLDDAVKKSSGMINNLLDDAINLTLKKIKQEASKVVVI